MAVSLACVHKVHKVIMFNGFASLDVGLPNMNKNNNNNVLLMFIIDDVVVVLQ